MQYEEFLTRVRDRSNLADRDHAEHATRATLDVLGQRLTGGETADLAAYLPTELRSLVDTHAGDAESFDVDEFLYRVANREARECGPEMAREHARAVMATVVDSVPAGELEDFRSQLPAGYDMLLQ